MKIFNILIIQPLAEGRVKEGEHQAEGKEHVQTQAK